MLTNRAQKVLILLVSQSERLFTIDELAVKFDVTSRTIRNDLEIINDFLSRQELGNLERETMTVVSLPTTLKEKKSKHLNLMHIIKSQALYLTPEERLKTIYIEILLNPNVVKIEGLINILQVSKSTVISDLNMLREKLKKQEIYLRNDNTRGYFFKGSEKNIRKIGLIYLNQTPYLKYMVEDNIQNGYWEHFSSNHIEFLEQLINQMEINLNVSFSGDAFSNILYGLFILVLRIKQKEFVKDIYKNHTNDVSFSYLMKYIEEMEKDFAIRILNDEVAYIIHLFQEGSIIEAEGYLDENWVDLYLFTNNFINRMSQKLKIQLMQDQDLFQSLILHLGPAFNRIENNTHFKNEIIDFITNSYSELFSLVELTLNELTKNKNIKFNTDEIGFITLHVAASLEKLSSSYKMNIIIVCNYGIGTSKLLKNRIEKFLSFNILKTITAREVSIDYPQMNNVDLIVSTVPLNEEVNIPIEIVSPLLTDEEILKLKKIEVEKTIFDQKLLSHTKELIRGDDPMLRELLTEDVIDVNVTVKDWEEAVRYGGNLLKSEGVIEQRYIDMMIQTVKELGPYIVIAPGIAMPHASSKEGVNKIGISLITLKEPIEFGNQENDPVSIVVTLATVDHTSHLRALSELVSYLGNDKFVSKILSASTVEEVKHILEL